MRYWGCCLLYSRQYGSTKTIFLNLYYLLYFITSRRRESKIIILSAVVVQELQRNPKNEIPGFSCLAPAERRPLKRSGSPLPLCLRDMQLTPLTTAVTRRKCRRFGTGCFPHLSGTRNRGYWENIHFLPHEN